MDNLLSSAADARSVDAGRGVAWWTEAWAQFMKNAGMWIVLALVWFVIFLVLGFIPFLGGLVAALLAPVFVASWMMTVRKASTGGALEVGDLFVAFKSDKLTPLIIVGALLLAAVIVIGVIVGVMGAGAVFGGAAAGGSRGGMFAALGASMFILLIGLVLGAVIGMAFWFAPALVVFRGVQPVQAVQASFAASIKNIGPMVLFGLIYIVASIVASIPFGLGWIVLIPVTLIAAYTSYTDIFGS